MKTVPRSTARRSAAHRRRPGRWDLIILSIDRGIGMMKRAVDCWVLPAGAASSVGHAGIDRMLDQAGSRGSGQAAGPARPGGVQCYGRSRPCSENRRGTSGNRLLRAGDNGRTSSSTGAAWRTTHSTASARRLASGSVGAERGHILEPGRSRPGPGAGEPSSSWTCPTTGRAAAVRAGGTRSALLPAGVEYRAADDRGRDGERARRVRLHPADAARQRRPTRSPGQGAGMGASRSAFSHVCG